DRKRDKERERERRRERKRGRERRGGGGGGGEGGETEPGACGGARVVVWLCVCLWCVCVCSAVVCGRAVCPSLGTESAVEARPCHKPGFAFRTCAQRHVNIYKGRTRWCSPQ